MTNDERLDLIEKQINEIHYNVMKIIQGEISGFCHFTSYIKEPARFVAVTLHDEKSCAIIACPECNPGILKTVTD